MNVFELLPIALALVQVRGRSLLFIDIFTHSSDAEDEWSTWTVPNNYRRNIREIDHGFKLRISDVRDENVGNYTCTDGRANFTAQLSVIGNSTFRSS